MRIRFLLIALLALLFHPFASVAELPRLMLSNRYHGQVAVSEYLVSEKLDGVRGRWDGKTLWTRAGQPITTPAWFTDGWPTIPMDGELWMGREQFDAVSGLVRAGNLNDPRWKDLHFMMFDLPQDGGTFQTRAERMRNIVANSHHPQLNMVEQRSIADAAALDAELERVVKAGGEGLMLHRRDAYYRIGRSDDLLKYKPYDDAEARVVAHIPGKGKYAGMLGALLVELPDGRQFRLGTGFTDTQRAEPPSIGVWVTYRYNGLTRLGLPRFARFMRVRDELPPPDPTE